MNLTKLFNFKYLKENLKKSKGAVALLVLIVPIFTLLVTVLLLNNFNVNIASRENFASINIIGMYIIPVLISLVLFGYVYKKKSVDFINSQPINRKTIFMTNTLGGIILITLIQVITAIILLICGAVLPNLVVFPKMVLDIFIMMWIGYVFVFLASNVAMSISGTFCTQIVVTLLILFLVPFCYDGLNGFDFSINCEINNNGNTHTEYLHTYEYYTFPYQLIHSMVTYSSEEFNIFSVQMLSRTVILSIVYYFIGLHLFKKRKMENNEESFASDKFHALVKGLTMFPMMIILNFIKDEKELIIFLLAIIVTYYFVYDFIVKRKMKLKSSLIYLFLSLAILQGICSANELIRSNMSLPKMNIENIAEVKVENLYYNNNFDYYNVKNTVFGGYIDDKEFIKLLFDSAYSYNIEEHATETSEVIGLNGFDVETVKCGTNEDYYASCSVILKMKNGKLYSTNLTIYKEDLDKVKNILANNEEFISNIKNALIKKCVVTLNHYMIITGEEKDTILKEIETRVNTMTFEELVKEDFSYQNAYICKYFYENHRLQGISIPADISDEVVKIVKNHTNKAVIETIRKDLNKTYNYQVYYQNENNHNYGESMTYLYYADDITKFILENENEEFDVTKPYCYITLDGKYRLQFYTNKVEEVTNIVNKAKAYEDKLNEEKDIMLYQQ